MNATIEIDLPIQIVWHELCTHKNDTETKFMRDLLFCKRFPNSLLLWPLGQDSFQ